LVNKNRKRRKRKTKKIGSAKKLTARGIGVRKEVRG